MIANMVDKRCTRFLKRKYGLSLPQFDFLCRAVSAGQLKLGDIADGLNCTIGNLSGVADRLERDQWVVRNRSVQDRRVVHVAPTEKCLRELPVVSRSLREKMAALTKSLPPEDQAQVYQALSVLRDSLRSDLAS